MATPRPFGLPYGETPQGTWGQHGVLLGTSSAGPRSSTVAVVAPTKWGLLPKGGPLRRRAVERSRSSYGAPTEGGTPRRGVPTVVRGVVRGSYGAERPPSEGRKGSRKGSKRSLDCRSDEGGPVTWDETAPPGGTSKLPSPGGPARFPRRATS